MAINLEDYEALDGGAADIDLADYEDVSPTPTGLPSINEPTSVTPPTKPQGIQLPEPVKAAAQALYTPVRGTRSIGVGIEKLLAGINPLKFSGLPGTQLDTTDVATIIINAEGALMSAADATQPGYVPQEGEKIGAFLGEAAGAAALTAPVAAAGATPLAAAGVNAAVGGGLSALQQASEKGAISPEETALAAGLSGAVPLLRPAYNAFKETAKKILPEILAKTQNAPKIATKIRLEDPEIMKTVEGTEEAIRAQVDDIQRTLNGIREEAGAQLRQAKVDLGLEVTPEEEIARLAKEGSPLARGAREIRKLSKQEPLPELATEKLIGPTGQAYGKEARAIVGASEQVIQPDAAAKMGVLSPKEIANAYQVRGKVPESQRLKYLYELKKQINEHVEFRPGVVKAISTKEEGLLKQIAKKADSEMQSLPGGDRLKAANERFSKSAGLYDALQKKLETPGMAEDSLAKLFRGDLSVITEGRNKDVQALLGQLDEMAGRPVTKQLWREMTVKHFKKYLGRGLGPFFTGLGGVNLAALTGGQAALAAGAISAPLVSPRVASAGIRAAQTMNPYIAKFLTTISNPKLQSAIISAIATPKGERK